MKKNNISNKESSRYNINQQESADKPASCQPEGQQGVTYKKYITKQDILDLLQYEKENGYQFNRMPSDEFIALLNGDDQMPILLAMIHNGVEVRAFFKKGSVAMGALDMPFSWFFKINEAGNQSSIELDKPSKGFDVIRYLSKTDINSLRKYNVAINGSETNLPSESSMSEMGDDDCYEIFFTTVHPVAGIHAHFGNGNAMFVPFSQYFSLKKKVRPWQGWFNEDVTKEVA